MLMAAKFLTVMSMLVMGIAGIMANASQQPIIVDTRYGKVKGVESDGVISFKGIPFAAPPVGELRWRAPQPAQPWQGVRDASEFGFSPAQASWSREGGARIMENSSEDCLYLNIWRPKNGTELPVMVWIYGGAFVGGSSSQPMYSGEEFAKQGVMLVSFNYRLGNLGHFAFPALSEENPEEAKGSYAYMDMVAALKWIKDNIAAFGGNPENITIFGESAGGVSVHTMLTIPAADGLFEKAIIESGGGRTGVLSGTPLSEAEKIGINFARAHGINGTDKAALDSLRALTVEEVVMGGESENGIRMYAGPIIDGNLVKESFEDAYYGGRFAKVPLMIGSNSAESGGGFIRAEDTDRLFSIFGKNKAEAMKIYNPGDSLDFRSLMTMVTTDRVWAEPARFTAKEFTKAGLQAYVYMFSYVPDGMRQWAPLGAPHASELPYVFNTLDTLLGNGSVTETDKKVARQMNSYWANFAKNGNPNGTGLAEWPVFTLDNSCIMEMKPDGDAVGEPEPKKARLDIIEKTFGR